MTGIRAPYLGYALAAALLCPEMVRAVPPMPPDLHDVAGNPLPPVVWTQSFNFDDGPQGWSISNCGGCPTDTAHWVNPATEPFGPLLPDDHDGISTNGCQQCESGSSGWLGETQSTGGGSLYLPGVDHSGDESLALRTIDSIIPGLHSTNSLVMQVDVYIPNLLPLTGFGAGGAYPGNHLVQAGFCMVNQDNASKAMCLEGGDSTESANAYLRFRDFTGSAGNLWQFPTCCPNQKIMSLEGFWPSGCNTVNTDKVGWWDNWVTLYINYNYSRMSNGTTPGEVYVWAYIPWEHPKPNCGYPIVGPGWIEIVRRPITPAPQSWTQLQLSGAFSWTQGQWDNVKIALTAPCHIPAADSDGDGDVDMDDFGAFQRCYTGPASSAGTYNPAACHCFDRYPIGAPDNAIDNNDFQAFAACAHAAGVPAGPNCN